VQGVPGEEDDELVGAQAQVQHQHENQQREQQPGGGQVPDAVGQFAAQRAPVRRRPTGARCTLVGAANDEQRGQRDQEGQGVDQHRHVQQPGHGQQPGCGRADDLAHLVGRLQPRVRRHQPGTGEHVPHCDGERGVGEHGHGPGGEGQRQDQPRRGRPRSGQQEQG